MEAKPTLFDNGCADYCANCSMAIIRELLDGPWLHVDTGSTTCNPQKPVATKPEVE
jgi:hypothetical protein